MMQTQYHWLIRLMLGCAFIAVSLHAQIDPQMTQGLAPYKSYNSGNVVSVSLTTQNVFSFIPLWSFPQRGGKLQSGMALEFNTPVYTVQGGCNPYTGQCYYYWTPPNWMGYSTVALQQPLSAGVDCAQPGNPLVDGSTSACWGVITDVTGATHILGRSGPPNIYQALDGSGWQLDGSSLAWAAIDKQGIRYGSVPSEDPNGNEPDTQGRGWGGAMDGTQFQANSTDTSYCSGPPAADGKAFSVYIYTVPAASGGTVQYKLCYADYYINMNDNPSEVNPFQQYVGLLQSVVLPNDSAWTFKYNNWGDVDEIDFPTGGAEFVSYNLAYPYTSANYPYILSADAISGFHESDSNFVNPDVFNSQPAAGPGVMQWTAVNVPGNAIGMVDPNGNETDHIFTPYGDCGNPYETETDYYTGNGSGKVLLRKVNRTYQTIVNPYVYKSAPCSYDQDFALPLQITTTEANGQVKRETRTYDSGFVDYGGLFPNAPYGQVVEDDLTDYGSGSPGPVLRKTITTYEFEGNTNYLNNNLLQLPESVLVYDGNNNEQAFTTYGYDENPLGNGNSNGVSLDANPPDGGYRGNLTSVHRWVNAGNYDLVTGYTYNDTGTLASSTFPGINAPGPVDKTYQYSSAFDGALRTGTTDAMGHTISGNYDFNSGLLTSYTGENGNTSNFNYDQMNRLVSAVFPSVPVNCATPDNPGGCATANPETWYFYHDTPSGSSSPSYVERRQCQNDDSNDCADGTDLFVDFDGLGREQYRYSNNGQGAWTESAVCLTPDGQTGFSVYPFTTSSPSAPGCNAVGTGLSQGWPGDATTYDGLGRPLTITHSDGTVISTSYSGRATEVSDEGNYTYHVTRISQINGLGELTNVCEVDSQSLIGNGGSPSACGLDIGATGFLTSYSYNTLGDLTLVQQNGLNNRGFVYDSLGRLTSSDNPETGAISYAYDNAACGAPAAPGALTCRTDAGNVSTSYFYDADHRLTEKAYSDGITPALYLNYDQSSAFGLPIVNGQGKETSAVSGATAEAFSYDSMSRLGEHIECYSYNCAALDTTLAVHYGYDLMGDKTMLEEQNVTDYPMINLTFNYSYNQSARLTGVTSNWVDATHPTTLLSGLVYNARGQEISGTLGNGVGEQFNYDGSGLGVDAPGRGIMTGESAGPGGSIYNFNLIYTGDGDIYSVNDSVNGDWTYDYDPMNRLVQANCVSGVGGGCDGVPNGNGLLFVYDHLGNLWQLNYVNSGQAGVQQSFSGGNHSDYFSYNADGDVTGIGAHNFSYDAENQLVQVDGGQTASYTYFPSGNRATKTVGGVTYWYLWDDAGHELAKLSNAGVFERGEIYTGGRHLGSYVLTNGGRTDFDYTDFIASTRVITDNTGNILHSCSDWAYGYNRTCTGNDSSSPMHFTGKPHDNESNLDDFGARYYFSNIGRFMTPDWSTAPSAIPFASLANPQSLNLYTYTLDNPVTNTDPDGHWCTLGFIGTTCTHHQKAKVEKNVKAIKDTTVNLLKTTTAALIVTSGIPATVAAAKSGVNWVKNNPEQAAVLGAQIAGALVMGGDAEEPALLNENIDRNPAQDKLLTRGEIKMLKEAGYEPEQLKEDIGGGGQQDIYKDSKGNLYVKAKNSSEPGEPLGININQINK